MAHKEFGKQELAALTEEELAALNDPETEELDEEADDAEEGDEDGKETAEGDAEDKTTKKADEDGKEGSDDEEGDDKAGEDEPDAAKDAAAEGAEAEGEGDEPAAKAAQPPLPAWKAPDGAQARIDAIETELDQIAAKFDDGELTAAEMRAQMKPLQAEQRDLSQALLKQEISHEAQIDRWENSVVPDFLAAHPQYKEGSLLFGVLDQAVRQLQIESKTGPFDPAILAAAHKRIQAELGQPAAAAPKPAPKQKPSQRVIPPTLAHVPADEIGDASEGEFAHLDRLTGTDLEKAVARMTEEQRDRWAAGG